jgi:hypothetical protein
MKLVDQLLGQLEVVRRFPNLCICGCIRPTGRGSGDSGNAIWSRECRQLTILPLPIRRQTLVAAPVAVEKRQAVFTG